MEQQAAGWIVRPDQGYIWEMEPGRVAVFKLLSEQTAETIAIFTEEVPVGGGTPVHIHRTSDEVIYLLAGEFTVKIGEQITNVEAGSIAFIPRGRAHAWRNAASTPGKALYIFAPAGGAKVFEKLSLLQLPVPAIDQETFSSYLQKYDYELVTWDW